MSRLFGWIGALFGRRSSLDGAAAADGRDARRKAQEAQPKRAGGKAATPPSEQGDELTQMRMRARQRVASAKGRGQSPSAAAGAVPAPVRERQVEANVPIPTPGQQVPAGKRAKYPLPTSKDVFAEFLWD